MTETSHTRALQEPSGPAQPARVAIEDVIAAPDPPVREPWYGVLRRPATWWVLGAVLGVLVPLAVMARVATMSAPSFDGAMNLQVADNITKGLGFVRRYGDSVLFPEEIQTSGVYIFLAAGLIGLFGTGAFALQLTNILFLGLLLVGVSFALKPWPLLRIIGPSIVLFAAPGMNGNVMSGYGEYVVAALVVGSFVLIGRVATGGSRPMASLVLAAAAIGAALTVKIVAAMALPVFVIGLVGVALARPALRRSRILLSASGALLPIVPVELYRLISFGSVREYTAYWTNQFSEAGSQAGVTADGPTQGILAKIRDHLSVLVRTGGAEAWPTSLAVMTPFLVLILLFLVRGESWRSWLARPQALLAVMLASYAGGYLIWWLAVTPSSKAWIRRIIIGLVVVVLLYLVVAGMVKDHFRRADRSPAADRVRRTAAGVAWVALAGVALAGLRPAVLIVDKQTTAALDQNSRGLDMVQEIAGHTGDLYAQGNVIYGMGWWAAPQVSLFAEIPMGNLSTVEPCAAETGLVDGRAYLVWDFYATNIAAKVPHNKSFVFVELPEFTNSQGSIWQVTVKPEVCAAQ